MSSHGLSTDPSGLSRIDRARNLLLELPWTGVLSLSVCKWPRAIIMHACYVGKRGLETCLGDDPLEHCVRGRGTMLPCVAVFHRHSCSSESTHRGISQG